MRKILFILFLITIFIYGCSFMGDDNYPEGVITEGDYFDFTDGETSPAEEGDIIVEEIAGYISIRVAPAISGDEDHYIYDMGKAYLSTVVLDDPEEDGECMFWSIEPIEWGHVYAMKRNNNDEDSYIDEGDVWAYFKIDSIDSVNVKVYFHYREGL